MNAYDCAGRLVSVTDALGGVTSYGYDLAGNMITQTDALGRVTTYEYDIMSRRVKRTLPGGQAETYNSYDAAGNLLSKTNFNGQVISYTYHTATDRLLTKTGLGINVSYAYDSAGRRQSMTDNSGTTTYNYDIRDRLTTKTTPLGALTYTYAGGMLSGVSSNNANGVSVSYGYDGLSRLQTVTDNRFGNSTTYSYDANGSLETCVYPNDVKHTWTYNDNNRLTNLRISKTTVDITLKSFAYTLGPTGNRTKVVENSGRTADWTYDDLYRLTNENVTASTSSPNYSATYSYDAVGNRQMRVLTPTGILPQLPDQDFTSDYDSNDRLLEGYNYNSNGSTTAAPDGWSYTYDAENRLLTAANGTNTISYVYDGDGNRATKNANGVITRYLTDSNNPTGYVQVVEELTGAYAVVKRYAYGHDLISQTDASTGAAYYYGYDGTGSTRLLTDDSGAVAATYDYDAFGTLVYSSGSIPNSYLFHGEQYDADLEQYYLRARYMSPQIGRFWTMDEFEGDSNDPRSLHKYLFVENNPANGTDPSGLFMLMDMAAANSIRSVLTSVQVEAGLTLLLDPSIASAAGITDPKMKILFMAVVATPSIYLISKNLFSAAFRFKTSMEIAGELKRGLKTGYGKSVFWSGAKAETRAMDYAIQHGKETIGMTQTGKGLVHLGDSINYKAWESASEIWADNAEGIVHVFLDNPRSDSIWNTTELPKLLDNPKVPVIIAHIKEGGQWILKTFKGSSL